MRPSLLLLGVGEGNRLAGRPATDTDLVVVVDEKGQVASGSVHAADILLTTASTAPAPWVTIEPDRLAGHIGHLRERVARFPLASSILCQLLRTGEALEPPVALVLESLAYSSLLFGSEFREWRGRVPPRRATGADGAVCIERNGNGLVVTLDRPARHNALNAAMRSQLAEALRLPLADPSIRSLTLRGEGSTFSSGGDLDEFGTATDAALAHQVRLHQSAAGLILGMTCPVSVELQGRCFGAGVEIAAAAGTVRARLDTSFTLPEIGMGLIPGAGGTVTITRRVSRQRMAWMAISGMPIDARTALDWGLIDDVILD